MKGKGLSVRRQPAIKMRLNQKQKLLIAGSSLVLLVFGISIFYLNIGPLKRAKAAVTYTWTGAAGTSWNNAGNWLPAAVPTSGDVIIIGSTVNKPMLSGTTSITTLTLNTGSNLNLNGFSLSVNGNMTLNSGAVVDLNGNNLSIGGIAALSGGTITNSGQGGGLLPQGSSTIFGNSTGGPVISADVTVSSNNITLRNTTFNGTASFTKTGSGSDYSYGGNTFNGNTIFTNAGSSTFLLANSVHDNFTNTVSFLNTGSGTLYVAYNDTVATTFSDNIVVSSTAGSGVHFGAGSGYATLAAGKTISIGSAGFTSGTLLLRHFSQSGNAVHSLMLGNAATLTVGPASSFGGPLTASSGSLFLNGCNFGGTVTLTKTGSSNNAGQGGNIFTGNAVINNTGSGYLMTGNVNADVFQADATFNNTGTGDFYIANSAAGNQFNGNTTINNAGSGSGIEFYIGEGGALSTSVFNGDLTVINAGTASSSFVRFNLRGTTQLNGDLILSSTTGTSGSGIYFGWPGYSGSAFMAATKSIQIGPAGFANGTLLLTRFSQAGSAANMLNLSGVAGLTLGPNSSFGGDVTATAAALILNGCTFGGTNVFTKTGTTSDQSAGNNVFNGNTSITNTGSGYILMGNTGPDIFNADAQFNNYGTGDYYLAYNSAGNQYNGNVVINNTGNGGTHNFTICEGSVSSTALFNGKAVVTNGGSLSAGIVRFNLRGTCSFGDSVILSSVIGSTSNSGIHFGWPGYTGSATMDSSATLGLSAGGFSAGTLSLIQFTKTGSDSVYLPMTGNTGIVLGPSTTLGGNFNSNSAAINLNGCNFGGSVFITKTGSSSETSTGGNTISDITSITNTGTGTMILGNTNPDIFNGVSTFTNSGHGNIYLAHNSAGNQFNGNVFLFNTGNGSGNRIYLTEGSAVSSAVFNGDVTVNNTGNGGASYIRFNLRGTSTFNGNIILNSTAGNGNNSYGVYFSYPGYSGSATQAAGKNISIGSTGFTKGDLYLHRFTQAGTTATSLPLPSTVNLIIGPFTSWGGDFTASAGSLQLNGCTFNGQATLTKSGTNTNNWTGGNTFSGVTSLTNSGSGNLSLGNGNPDSFADSVTVTNNGSGYVYLADATAGNQFAGPVTLNNTGSGSDLRILVCEGTSLSTAVFNDDVTINNTGSASTSLVRFSLRGAVTLNGNLILNSTAGTGNNTCGIFFSWAGYSGTTSMASGKTISIGSAGFTRGDLALIRFTQAGTEPVVLNVPSTTDIIFGPGSSLGGNVTATAGSILLNGCTFGGTTTLTKTGSVSDNGTGGNIFNGVASITNSGNSSLSMGNSSPDVFNADAVISNSGTSYLYLAHGSAGNTFNGNTILNNTGSGADLRFMVCEGTSTSSSTFNGNVTINNNGTATDGFMRFNLRGTCNFNGNITVNSSIGNSGYNGVDFGWPGYNGTASLAPGKTITTGTSGITKGQLLFQNFSQSGATAQNITLSGTAVLTFQSGTTYNGTVNATGPTMFLNGATFNGVSSFTKTGVTNDASTGNNTFNGPVTVTNSGTGTMTLANTTRDVYNDDATFIQTGTGALYPANNGINTFAADVSTIGTAATLTFGNSAGSVSFNGTAAQAIHAPAGFAPVIKRLVMNNSSTGLTLNTPVTVSTALTLTSGTINTTAVNLLVLGNGITSVAGVSNSSYVNGPMRKTGNQAFTFPIGKNGNYRPLSIAAPSSVTEQFEAEYFFADPNTTYPVTNRDPTIHHTSRCEFWMLNRIAGSSNVHITLSWNTTSCGVNGLAAMMVARWDAGSAKWKDLGNGGFTGNTTAGTVISSVLPGAYGPFTLASNSSSNPLPIELVYFKAELEDNHVNLEWQTLSEQNNDYFTVERSGDGQTYELVGTLAGQGTTSQSNTYTMTDLNPLHGTSYYRLKQTDYDGKFNYFKPETVKNSNQPDEFKISSVAPNPFQDQLKVNFYNPTAPELEIQLTDLNGKLIYTNRINTNRGQGEVTLDQLSAYPAGIYFLRILHDGNVLQMVKTIKR